MQFPRRTIPLAILLLLLSAGVQLAVGKKKNSSPSQMDEQKRALHALNRLTFGPTPGEVDQVAAMGVDKWIDQQLHPERIDDQALDARLTPLRTLRMDTREIVENFPPPQVIKAVANGKQPLPNDATLRAVYESQIDRLQNKEKEKAQQAGQPSTGTQDQMQRLDSNQKTRPQNEFMDGMTPQQRETVMALNNPQQVVRRRTGAGQTAASHLQRTPAGRSDDRLLVQPLQRLHRQRR